MVRLIFSLLFALGLQVFGAAAAEPGEIVFCSYNVENFTDAKPPSESSRYGVKAKPEKAIAALVEVVKEIRPDILGMCEMGSPEKLAELQKRLAEAGIDLPHSEFVAGLDEDRHLALLSRFPIVARNSAADVRFELEGQQERVRRGFLDVTIAVNDGYQLRCVGAHLKSKLPIPEGQEVVRRLEAQKLREHLDAIFEQAPETNLMCYGDFNDTKDQPMFHAVTGPRGTPGHLNDLWCRDQFGDKWTYYWKVGDQYSRIDYLMASAGLWPEVNRASATVYRSEHWSEASDHRPIFASIRPVEAKHR
jgi:endonuclease/exonuclease/phosphatase family metal-dependent hydrolase